MAVAAERVAEVLGLKSRPRSIGALAAAVEHGLPKASLERVIDRVGVTGSERQELLHRVVPAATFKRRTRLKVAESERTERLARVVALAELLWEEPEEAQRFLMTVHPELNGRRPVDAALSELGARQVEDIVMRALHGLPV
jgi:putative toxin-antitoxin system antitoxin component (TIGR02293 family)